MYPLILTFSLNASFVSAPKAWLAPFAIARLRPPGVEHADRAPAPHVALDPEHREVGRPGARRVVGLDIERAHAVSSDPAGDAAPGHNRHLLVAVKTYPPAEEQERHDSRAAGGTAEVEHPAPFEEELALLRKLQVEARQVDLLLIRFDLCKVRVVGEVHRKVLREPVLDVHADVGAGVVDDRRRGACDPSSGGRSRTA